MATLTGASAIITLTVPGIFNAPVQLQGFAADDVFDTDAQEITEISMGVDGILSGGYVFVPVKQTFTLQADSASNFFFETWAQQQRIGVEAFVANGNTNIVATGKTYTMTRGFLTTHTTVPSVKKLLAPRKYTVTWNRIVPSPN
ncbi:MAG TPA: hypothetical protein VHP34_11575 [Alphaproteobacteria bacterium]|nr:hypothetical protein [Alphaproteobacteria bacterium]